MSNILEHIIQLHQDEQAPILRHYCYIQKHLYWAVVLSRWQNYDKIFALSANPVELEHRHKFAPVLRDVIILANLCICSFALCRRFPEKHKLVPLCRVASKPYNWREMMVKQNYVKWFNMQEFAHFHCRSVVQNEYEESCADYDRFYCNYAAQDRFTGDAFRYDQICEWFLEMRRYLRFVKKYCPSPCPKPDTCTKRYHINKMVNLPEPLYRIWWPLDETLWLNGAD